MEIPTNLDDFSFDNIKISFENKRFLSNYPKFIVTTGAIGVGKTTWNIKLSKYIRSKGFKVYLSNEIPLTNKPFLELFYSDIQKYSFAFQLSIIHKFNNEMLKIYFKRYDYDYIILDRTHLDTKIFTSNNIKNENELHILEDLLKNNLFESSDFFDYVFYLKPSVNTMLERQEKRARESEKSVDKQYLIDIYNKYETMIMGIYPNYIIIQNENGIDYDDIFKQYFNGKQYEQSLLVVSFLILLFTIINFFI